MIKDATFTSIWDGDTVITTACKVNTETKEVFDVEMAEVDESLDLLDTEYVTIDDNDYPVSDDGSTEYWYR
jgi:hypothetical protein